MLYLKTSFIFVIIFIFFNLFLLQLRKFNKNTKKIKFIERQLLWKIPNLYIYFYTVLPNLTSVLLFNKKNKLIEEQLSELLNTISLNLSAGIPIIESIKQTHVSVSAPIKNELSMFILFNNKDGQLKAFNQMKQKSKNIYLKILWGILENYLKNGGSLAQNIKNFANSLNSKINMENKIKGQLIQSKIQIYIGSVLPYLLFAVMNLLYKDMMQATFHSNIGITIISLSLLLHAIGVYLFIKISKFNNKNDIRDIIAIEYLAFTIQSGISIIQGFKDLSENCLCDTETHSIISQSCTSFELIKKLSVIKDSNIKYIVPVLEKSLKLGIPIAEELTNIAENLRFKLEQRAVKFQQTAPTKALIPLFLCIFPATYILILTPILIRIISNNSNFGF